MRLLPLQVQDHLPRSEEERVARPARNELHRGGQLPWLGSKLNGERSAIVHGRASRAAVPRRGFVVCDLVLYSPIIVRIAPEPCMLDVLRTGRGSFTMPCSKRNWRRLQQYNRESLAPRWMALRVACCARENWRAISPIRRAWFRIGDSRSAAVGAGQARVGAGMVIRLSPAPTFLEVGRADRGCGGGYVFGLRSAHAGQEGTGCYLADRIERIIKRITRRAEPALSMNQKS